VFPKLKVSKYNRSGMFFNHWTWILTCLRVNKTWVNWPPKYPNFNLVLYNFIYPSTTWPPCCYALLVTMKWWAEKWKINFHLNENIEWHCMQPKLNWNFIQLNLIQIQFDLSRFNRILHWLVLKFNWRKIGCN
jgi:hypothetical protein